MQNSRLYYSLQYHCYYDYDQKAGKYRFHSAAEQPGYGMVMCPVPCVRACVRVCVCVCTYVCGVCMCIWCVYIEQSDL